MICHRVIVTITTLFVTTALTAAPAAAASNPLLSGYGGPGEGEQAILGSTLIGGPNSSGGRAGGSGSAVAGELAAPSGGASSGRQAGGAAHGGPPAHAHTGTGAAARHARSVPPPSATRTAPARTLANAASSQPLGISTADFLYMLLALLALGLTGALTLRLSHPPRGGGG